MRELHHNSRATATNYIAVALEIVEELDPPEDLRTAAFVKACECVSAKSVTPDPEDIQKIAVPAMAMPRNPRRN